VNRINVARYLLGASAVAAALGLRLVFIPLMGTGAPFAFFFGAVTVTSLAAGVGPGIFALLLSLPLAAYWFVVSPGTPLSQAVFQSLVFVVAGLVVIYLTFLMRQSREAAQDANHQLRQANEDVKRAEARTRELLELAPDAFVQCDLSFHFTDVNQAACDLLGYTRDEFLKKSIFEVITEEDANRLKAVRDKLLVPGQVERSEWILRRKDGSVVPAEVSANILPDGRWQAFSRDITERKKTEEALRRAVTARDHVLGIVAHDLRNPLASIVHSAALAQREADSERLHHRLDLISRAAMRMNQLIQGLLDVSLIEAGQLQLKGERVRTADLVRQAVELQMPLASSSGLTIRVDLTHTADDLWGSHERLEDVFENLIGNAIKFTEAGGLITVGAASRDQDVLFSVADTGCGIPPESLPHVFDRFWQAVPRAGRLGAGLGLAITKGIIEAHGGRIWVESTAGRGSTFFFTIPKAPSDADYLEHAGHELHA